MQPSPAFLALADERFVSLTTFRKSGEPVSTPVWIARDGDDLVVTTPAGSGKVKRLRNNTRVELRPSSRMGRVDDDAPVVAGTAEVVEGGGVEAELTRLFLAKYRLEYRIFLGIERLGRSGRQKRVRLTIRPVDS